MMRHWKRLTAMLLAVGMVVSGLPVTPSALAWGNVRTGEQADPAEAEQKSRTMRFVQTEFKDGILTMSLQIRVTPTAAEDGMNITREAISEGFFTFQADANTLMPVTSPADGSPRELIRGTGGATAVVSSDINETMQKYLDSGSGQLISSDFRHVMSAEADNRKMDPEIPGLLVSSNRVGEWTDKDGQVQPGTGMKDYYLQFAYQWGGFQEKQTVIDGEYVSVMELRFYCIAGYDQQGNPILATDTGDLFAGSIRVPQNDTEAQAIVDQFSFTEEGAAAPTPMAMGAAGFVQKYKYTVTGTPGNNIAESTAYHYYTEPQLTKWRQGSSPRAKWNGKAAVKKFSEEAPGVWYDNISKKYNLTGFAATCANTFSTDELDPETVPDFTVPDMEVGSYPRYDIPTLTEATANDGAGKWVPTAYGGSKPVNLKYYIGTEVSANSISRPETVLGLEGFLENVKWEFILEDGISLEPPKKDANEEVIADSGCTVTETGEDPILIKAPAGSVTPTGTPYEYYRVKVAAITDDRYKGTKLAGAKVWKVSFAVDPEDPDKDQYYMTGPVGVILDMLDTSITYTTQVEDPNTHVKSDKEVIGNARAPQLHVTNHAADEDSAIWRGRVPGQLFFRAVYDPSGVALKDIPVQVRLYKEESEPTYTDLQTENIPTDVTESEETTAAGFWVGRPALNGAGSDTPNDAVAAGGISIHSYLYDQYRIPYKDKWPTVELKPDDGSASVFEVNQVRHESDEGWVYTNEYTIKYKDGMTVNDVKAGPYTLKSMYPGVLDTEDHPNTGKEPLEICKASDHLSYMSVGLTLPHETVSTEENVTRTLEDGSQGVGTVIKVKYKVPTETSTGAIVKKTETLDIKEIANQWRVESTNPSVYDIVPGMRVDGKMDLNQIRKQMGLTIKCIYPESAPNGYPMIIDTENINDGSFSFNSHTPDKAEMTCRIIAKHGDEIRFVEYQFLFERELSILQDVVINQPKNQSEISIPVPTLAQESAEGKKTYPLDVVPMNQYGSQWNWAGVEEAYKAGGRENKDGSEPYSEWSVYPVGDLPQGVTLTGSNNATIAVDHTAQDGVFQVYAQFGQKISNRVNIRIQREPRKPRTIESVSYPDGNTVIPLGNGGSDITAPPTLVVYDQYGEALTDYDMIWTYTISADTAADKALAEEKIKVNRSTGVITVDKCAPTCKVNLKVRVAKNSESKSKSLVLNVTRNLAALSEITVTNTEVKFPSRTEADTALTNLEATGTTQYGEGQAFAREDLTWELVKVQFPDGILSGSDITKTADDGYQVRSVSLTNRGLLSMSRVSSKNDIPDKLWVTVTYQGGVTSEESEIEITKDKEPKATTIFLPWDSYKDGFKVPDAVVGTQNYPLEAYVCDQYGIIMEEESKDIKWDVTSGGPLPSTIVLDKENRQLQVSYRAPEKTSFTLTASYGSLTPVAQSIYVWRLENPKVTTIEATGLRGVEGTEIPLPHKFGKGYADYTMKWAVYNQFRDPISGPVNWTVESANGGVRAEFTHSESGELRVYFEEAAYTVGTGVLTLRATSTTEGTTDVFGEITVSVVREAEQIPCYAVPERTSAGEGAVTEGGVLKSVVPAKDAEAPTKITVIAKVYDQYGKEIPDAPADLLMAETTGLSQPEATENTNEWILTLGPKFIGSQFTVTATPQGKPQDVTEESKGTYQIKKATAYADELSLDDDEYTFTVPYWGSDETGNVGSPDSTEQMELKAYVLDQFTAWLQENSDTIYPVWEFKGDHTGVTFATEEDEGRDASRAAVPLYNKDGTLRTPEGPVSGEEILLDVSNRASGTVQLKVTTWDASTHEKLEGDNFEKIVTITFLRDDRQTPTYLYFNGADENGFAQTPLERPYVDKKVATYQIKPELFDRYGTKIEDAQISVDLLKNRLPSGQGVQVEDVYKPGENEEEGTPIAYKIYQVEYPDGVTEEDEDAEEKAIKTLMAEFDRETGELKVYTACNTEIIQSLSFVAVSGDLTVGNRKVLTLPLAQEERKPYAVRLNRMLGDFMINGGEEPLTDYVTATVYNQYGVAYDGRVQITWSLHVRDENGELQNYDVELDEEGNPRLPDDFLIKKQDEIKAVRITVQPKSFFEEKTVILRCRVLDMKDLDLDKAIYNYANINVRRPSAGGGGSITVFFDAGKYGKLVGLSEYSVGYGEVPTQVPGVKTVEGYGFIGWTVDGKTLVDAAKTEIFSTTVYTAVYKDITTTEFLDGYGDGTVWPQQNVTRAEFVKMMAEGLGGYDSAVDYGRSFKDVDQKAWYANYIAYAKLQGVAQGYPDGTFRPEDPISRAEACKLLSSYLGLPMGAMAPFTDVPVNAWYANDVAALYNGKLIDGYEDGQFKPKRNITRAEAVKIIVMASENAPNEFQLENIREYAYCPFTDVKRGFWAYAYILRAAGIA